MAASSSNATFAQLRTIGDAITLVHSLFDRQVQSAEAAGTPPNESCQGDGEARDAFLLLLPPQDQRAVFLERIKSRLFWPRIRTCVGAPPFAFLRPEDDGVLRAAGIERHRKHMSNESNVPNANEFGRTGQFTDDAGRDYKLLLSEAELALSAESRNAKTLPFVGLVQGTRVVADVRVKRRTQKAKLDILRGVDTSVRKSALTFPARGTQVQIEPSRLLGNVVGIVQLRVQNVIPRNASSGVARLICTIG